MQMLFKNERLQGIFEVILGAALFGFVPVFVRFGKEISTPSLVFFRALFGMAFIYVIMRLLSKNLSPLKEDRLKLFLWAGVLVASIGFYFMALKLIDIGSAVLLLYGKSIFIILLSAFWLKERIRLHTIIALLLAIIGVVLIIAPSGFNFTGNSLGYVFGVAAALFSGLNFVFPKKYFKSYDTYSMTFYQFMFQLPILVVFMLLSPPAITVSNLGIFAGLGLLGTALAFYFIYSGSRKVKGQYIGILQTSEVIFSILLAFILFSEIPSLNTVFGGILLVAGYVIVAMNQAKT